MDQQVAARLASIDILRMDAPNFSAVPGLASRAPIHIGAVGLKARDIKLLTSFYQTTLGLVALFDDGQHVVLGAGGTGLFHLERAPAAGADDPHSAGLYHTAFLMPTRTDLAQWLRHAGTNLPLTGASDHGVSEAIYLDDPEGNGIEVYCDRPAETWRWMDGRVEMTRKRLDLDELLRAAPPSAGNGVAPVGLRIGHVHLRVGDLSGAEAFYHDAVGLDVTRQRDGALFMSSGHYHHHIACNVWHSEGAGMRDPSRAGLAWVALEVTNAAAFEALKSRLGNAGFAVQGAPDGAQTADPWGTTVRVRRV
jgi:catechol 2,3-dioxygenase